jgi:hemoglobin
MYGVCRPTTENDRHAGGAMRGAKMSESSLYERLGGEDKIRNIATTILENHLANDAVKARYADSDREEVIRVVTEFICAGTGGPQTYSGKDMLEAHKGMNVDEHEFVAVLDDILAALDTNGVGQREQEELLMIAYSLRGDILHV